MKAQFTTKFENEYVKTECAAIRIEVVKFVAHDMRRARGVTSHFDKWNAITDPALKPLRPGEQFDAVITKTTSKVEGDAVSWQITITPNDKRNAFNLDLDEAKTLIKSV